MKLLFLAALAACALSAQSTTPIACPAANQSNCQMMEAQAIPTSTAVITTANMLFGGGWVSCTTAQTITLTDGNGVVIPPGGLSLAAGQIYSLNLLSGSFISKGISIVASASGCKYHMWWRI